MRNCTIILLTLLLIISCKQDNELINDNTLLKELPQQVFELDSQHQIKTSDSIYTHNNLVERLPNNEFSKFYLKKHPDRYLEYFNVTINLSKDKKITIEGVEFFKEEVIDYLNEFIDFASEGKTALLHVNFDENLTLQDYLEFNNFLRPIASKSISISNQVFIYNTNLLPDCDCSL